MNISPPALTFGGLVRVNARARGGHPAIIFEGATTSWIELDAIVDRYACALLASGMKRGSMIAIHAANCPEWIYLALGCARIGAMLSPLNTFYVDAEIVQQIEHAEPRMLFAIDRVRRKSYDDLWRRLLPELADGTTAARLGRFARFPKIEQVIQLRGNVLPGAPTLQQWLAAGDAIDPGTLAAAEAQVKPEDDLYILYTSGSTGVPKGVRMRQGDALINDFKIGERQGLTASDSTWIATPMFYGLATINAIPAIWTHGGAILLQEIFDPGEALAAIEKYRPTTYVSLANMTRALYHHPERAQRDISSLKKGIAGFSPEDLRLAIEGLGVEHCCAMYGLTESYGNCFITEWTDSIEIRTTSAGRVLPGWEYRVVDEGGAPVAPGALGVIELKGPVTPGYLRNPAANAEAFTDDGYFRTGDIVHISADERLHFHGRHKEILKVGGVNISPVEIEKIIDGHPDVAECHIVGIPDETKGEIVAAFVDPGRAKLKEDDITHFVAERAARFKVPAHVFFMTKERMPRLASGKVPKYQLRQLAIKLLAQREDGAGG